MECLFVNLKMKTLFDDLFDQSSNKKLLIKKIGYENTIITKKRLLQIKASPSFYEYLKIGLGNPHALSENLKGLYGVSLLSNTRLVLKPNSLDSSSESLKVCTETYVQGVVDYHGSKEKWLVS